MILPSPEAAVTSSLAKPQQRSWQVPHVYDFLDLWLPDLSSRLPEPWYPSPLMSLAGYTMCSWWPSPTPVDAELRLSPLAFPPLLGQPDMVWLLIIVRNNWERFDDGLHIYDSFRPIADLRWMYTNKTNELVSPSMMKLRIETNENRVGMAYNQKFTFRNYKLFLLYVCL